MRRREGKKELHGSSIGFSSRNEFELYVEIFFQSCLQAGNK